jgi:hypothetical protein
MALFDRPGRHGPINNADLKRLGIHAITLPLATLEWKGKCVRFGVRFADRASTFLRRPHDTGGPTSVRIEGWGAVVKSSGVLERLGDHRTVVAEVERALSQSLSPVLAFESEVRLGVERQQ